MSLEGGGGLGSENRQRQNRVVVRLSDEELERLKGKAEKVGLTPASFLRELATRQKIRSPVMDYEAGMEVYRELKRIGNNLNQLARDAHLQKELDLAGLPLIYEEVRKIRQQLSEAQRIQQTVSLPTAKKEP